MKTVFPLLLISLLFSPTSYSKSKSKAWWIMKQTQGCLSAVGFMAPENVLKNNPRCKKDTNFPPGMMALDCRETDIGTQLAYFDNKEKCERMVQTLRSQGY
jgi:hypothetical protein